MGGLDLLQRLCNVLLVLAARSGPIDVHFGTMVGTGYEVRNGHAELTVGG